MLEETNKAIQSVTEISKRVATTFFNLVRYMKSNNIKKYTINKYIFTIETFSGYTYLNGVPYYNDAVFKKVIKTKNFFGIEKIKIEHIYSFYFNIENDEKKTIYYEIKNPLNVDEIDDAISFFLFFNEDIASKTNLMLEHEDEMKAFDKLLQNS